jgi:uncharacterized low-complexity protein
MKRKQKSTLTLALGSAIAAGLASGPAAADNPFSAQALAGGYRVAAADKAMEGKCGEGKCGAAMGASSPGKDAKTDAKAKTGAKAKVMEAKCGEGKCGGAMKGPADGSGKAVEGKCAGAKN